MITQQSYIYKGVYVFQLHSHSLCRELGSGLRKSSSVRRLAGSIISYNEVGEVWWSGEGRREGKRWGSNVCWQVEEPTTTT